MNLDDFIGTKKTDINTPSRAPTLTVTIKTSHGTQSFPVRRGSGFQALCAKNQTPIEFDCREADCGICIFQVLSDAEHLSDPTTVERDFLRAMRADANERLACQCRIFGDVTILVEGV